MKAQNNKPTIRCEPFTNKPRKQHMHIVFPKPKNKHQQNQAHHHVLWVIQIRRFNNKCPNTDPAQNANIINLTIFVCICGHLQKHERSKQNKCSHTWLKSIKYLMCTSLSPSPFVLLCLCMSLGDEAASTFYPSGASVGLQWRQNLRQILLGVHWTNIGS